MSPQLERQSLALPLIVSELGDREESSILDLGSATSANVTLFSKHFKKVYIADIRDAIGTQSSDIELPLPSRASRFDVVACWDLLDHLSERQVKSLVSRILKCTDEQTYLWSYSYRKRHIPKTPSAFATLSEEIVSIETDEQGDIAPRSKGDVRRLLEPFSLAHSFRLLQCGLDEELRVRRC